MVADQLPKMTALEISGRLLTRNTLFNFIGQAGPLLVAAATIPFIIRGLGVERFGVLAIAWVAPEYFVFVDLGLGRATLKYAAEALGKGDRDRLSRVAWTAVSLQLFLGLLGTLGLIGITPLLTDYLLNIPDPLKNEARAAFYVLALSIPIILISTSFNALLAAAQRFDLVNAVSASFNMTSFLLTFAGVVYLDWHLTEIVTMLVVSRLFVLCINFYLCVRLFPILAGRRAIVFTELRALLSFGGWATVSHAVIPVLLYLDRFMIGASLTMAAVAYYSLPYEIVTRLWILPMSLAATLFPAFSALIAQGERDRLATLLARAMKWVLLTLGVAVVIMTAFAGEILQLWLGAEFASESTSVFQILALGILINSMVQVQFALVQALGRPDLTAKCHLIQLPIHALLLWWLVGQWGIIGAAIAQAIRLGLEALLLFVAASRLFAVPFYSLLADKLAQSWLLLFMFVALAIGVGNLHFTMWLRLPLFGLIFAAMALVVWRYSFDPQDRDQLAKLFAPASARPT